MDDRIGHWRKFKKKKALERFNEDRDKYNNSDAHKKAVKQWLAIDKKFDEGLIDGKEYESEYERVRKSVYEPKFDTSVAYTDKGRKYVKEYVNGYGKDITVGYLQDLGYNKQTAEQLTKRIIKSNRKTIF